MRTSNNMDGTSSVARASYPQTKVLNRKVEVDSISSNDEWIVTTSSDTDDSALGDAKSDSDNDAGNNDKISKKSIAQQVVSKINQAPTSTSIYASDDADKNTHGNVDNHDDNNAGNSKKDIPMQNFLSKLNQVLPAPKTPDEQSDAADDVYDCREFARAIRGNWKIIAPTLTAASGVAAVAVLTIGARGSVAGIQLSLGARWGTWLAGYLMTQATIVIGAYCIPSFKCR